MRFKIYPYAIQLLVNDVAIVHELVKSTERVLDRSGVMLHVQALKVGMAVVGRIVVVAAVLQHACQAPTVA